MARERRMAALGTKPAWAKPVLLGQWFFQHEELTDTDGDGMLAWQEYVAGSVPTNSASVFLALITMTNAICRETQ